MVVFFSIFYLATLFYRILKDWSSSLLVTPISSLSFVAFTLLLLPKLLDDNIVISFQVYIGLTVICFFCLYIPKSFKQPLRQAKIKNKFFVRNIFYFLFITHYLITIFFGLRIVNEFGFVGAFFRNRLEDYLAGDVLGGGVISTFHLLSQFVFYYVVGVLLSSYKTKYLATFIVISYVILIAIYANTRLSVIIPIVVLMAYYIYVRKFRYTKILLYSLAVMILLPTYLVVANNLRHGIDEVDSKIDVKKVIANQLNYNKYVNELDDYISVDIYRLEFGSGWILASVGNFIPRFIWKDKPITSFSNRLTLIITGQQISLRNPVRTYTIFGTGYSQLGYAGVILEVVFYIYVFLRLFYSSFSNKVNGGAFLGFYIAILALIYFRGETPFVQLTIIYLSYFFMGAFHRSR